MLRPNPAAELYQRMGFVVSEETPTHVRMRWTANEASDAALQLALAPWLDLDRRAPWAARAFGSPLVQHVGFLRRRLQISIAPGNEAGWGHKRRLAAANGPRALLNRSRSKRLIVKSPPTLSTCARWGSAGDTKPACIPRLALETERPGQRDRHGGVVTNDDRRAAIGIDV